MWAMWRARSTFAASWSARSLGLIVIAVSGLTCDLLHPTAGPAESARVRLRPLSHDDVTAISELLRDDYEGIMQTARIPWPFGETDAAAFVLRALSESQMAWAVEEIGSGSFAGTIGA